MINNTFYKIAVTFIFALLFFSCKKNVEDGYQIEYNESATAQLNVSTNENTGAVNDTVSFLIYAKSDVDLKSIIVSSSISGSGGSGFEIPSGSTDPLIDHSYGTIQKNTKEFSLIYNYVITQDTADPVVIFKLIDNSGEKLDTQMVITLPSIVRYKDMTLYTHSSDKTDGFSTADSVRYRDLSNYGTESGVNKAVQKSIDIIFVVISDTAWLIAPYDWRFSCPATFIKNKTRFKLLPDVSSDEFDQITSSQLSAIIKRDSVKHIGNTAIQVQKGSIAGFFTDYGSANSYKAGMVRINAIHPSYCGWYTGSTYQIDMDIITQISK